MLKLKLGHTWCIYNRYLTTRTFVQMGDWYFIVFSCYDMEISDERKDKHLYYLQSVLCCKYYTTSCSSLRKGFARRKSMRSWWVPLSMSRVLLSFETEKTGKGPKNRGDKFVNDGFFRETKSFGLKKWLMHLEFSVLCV